mmetsp:Transcript_21545/g.53424  ORF Transcript_21545/g.53424 Transcript_21545/m.53424 type:complete len:205 (-) Transcript_21545:231-845(-)
MLCKSVVTSPSTRPTLYPPPRFKVSTVSQTLQKERDLEATCCQIEGSLPDPMCVWIRSTVSPYLATMSGTVPSSRREYQIPKDEAGPPTFVLENPLVDDEKPPEPVPGLTRMPTFCPVPSKACPMRSTCDTEQALILTPILMRSAKLSGSSCVLRLMFSAGIPASMARLTSNPEDASMWMPLEEKNFKMAELGQAFMAYRTVKP